MARYTLIRPTPFQRIRYRRPDKAKPPSGNWCHGYDAGWRVKRLSGLRRFSGFVTVGRIRRSRHPAIGAAEMMPDGALHAYPAYSVSANSCP